MKYIAVMLLVSFLDIVRNADVLIQTDVLEKDVTCVAEKLVETALATFEHAYSESPKPVGTATVEISAEYGIHSFRYERTFCDNDAFALLGGRNMASRIELARVSMQTDLERILGQMVVNRKDFIGGEGVRYELRSGSSKREQQQDK